MRILLGWLLLLSLAALAGLIQARWTDGVREERDALMRSRGARTSAAEEDDGWSQVVIGRPSGEDPFDMEWPPVDEGEVPGPEWTDEPQPYADWVDPGDDPARVLPPPPDPEPAPQVWQVTIQSGMVLSRLCAKAYGRGTPSIVEAVARYNELEDPDDLRVGDVVLLPPYGMLVDADGRPLPPLD